MAALKTQPTQIDVTEFIRTFADSEQKQKDSFELIEIMREITGCEPQMWGPSMIGFGKYHYKSERSRQEGDWPLVGFSPRKAAISLYVFSGMPEHEYLLENLGKFKKGAACDCHTKVLTHSQVESISSSAQAAHVLIVRS